MKGEGHSETPAINILLAAYTLTCGMHVDQVQEITKYEKKGLRQCNRYLDDAIEQNSSIHYLLIGRNSSVH